MTIFIHESITPERLQEAIESGDDTLGICTACGMETSGVEPDARSYRCDHCHAMAVCGVEELVLMVD